jgi:hypothetical protein
MATYKEKAICLAVLSVGVGAMFIGSFALHALPAFANARSNNWTSMQPQGVQSTQRVQNTTANNYTGLEEKKNKALAWNPWAHLLHLFTFLDIYV